MVLGARGKKRKVEGWLGRLKTARTTRDIDLAMTRLPVPSADWDANLADVLESLRDAGNLDLHDFLTFVFGDTTQDLDAAPCGGARASPWMRDWLGEPSPSSTWA